MNIIGVIPARYQSSRFPGKPLAFILGKPMIWWVYQQAVKVQAFSKVLVATDSDEIFEYCEKSGIPVEMTLCCHQTGTDRLGEIAARLDADFYVNIQGDEPMIEPDVIQTIIDYKLSHPDVQVINTMTSLKEEQDAGETSIVKAVAAENGDLLYLSRAKVPCSKKGEPVAYKRHLGLYGLSKEALMMYASTPRGRIESIEDIEMFRFMENGYRIKILEVNSDSLGVDLPEDIHKVEEAMKKKENRDSCKKKIKVSVIIPAYNVEPYVRECLDSVINQTLTDWEMICVDDASTDGTRSILKEYEKRDSRIKVLYHDRNKGQASARNLAFRSAQGEYIYMLDADDKILSEALEEIYAVCKEKDLDLAGFETKQFAMEDSFKENAARACITYEDGPVLNGREALSYCMERECFSLSVPTFMIRRAYMEKCSLHFVDGILHEDVGFIFEMMVRADRVLFLHKVYFLRRIRANSTMTGGFCSKNIEGYLKSLWKSFELLPFIELWQKDDGNFRWAFDRWQRDILGRICQLYRQSARDISREEGGSVNEEIKRAFYLLKLREMGEFPWKVQLAEGDRKLSLEEFGKCFENVYLCGTGQNTERMLKALGYHDIIVRGILVTDKKERSFCGFPLISMDDDRDFNAPVILSVSHYYADAYEEKLREKKGTRLFFVDRF